MFAKYRKRSSVCHKMKVCFLFATARFELCCLHSCDIKANKLIVVTTNENLNFLAMQLNTNLSNAPKKTNLLVILIISAAAVAVGYIMFTMFFPSRTAFDIPDKTSPKMVAMFDKQLQVNIDDHEQNSFHPGYLPTAKEHVAAYIKTITKLESYSRHGVNSSQARNAILLRITFADGSVVDKVHTGLTSSHVMPPPLLMNVSIKDGKTVSVLTNGMEKKGSPDWVIPDLNTVINAAISYDKNKNNNAYFPPTKTKQDFEKEWEEQ